MSTCGRVDYIDHIKGFAILMVILLHVEYAWTWVDAGDFMALFFFASGIFFKPQNMLSRTVKRVGVPFLFFWALSVALFALLHGVLPHCGAWFAAHFQPMDTMAPIRALTHFIYPRVPSEYYVSPHGWTIGINGALWFLVALFFTRLIYWVLWRTLRRPWLIGVGLLVCFGLSRLLVGLHIHGPFMLYLAFFFMFSYGLGALLGRWFIGFLDTLDRGRLALGALISAAVIVLWVCFVRDPRLIEFLTWESGLPGIGLLMIPLLFFLFRLWPGRWRLLDFFGRNSLIFLGVHYGLQGLVLRPLTMEVMGLAQDTVPYVVFLFAANVALCSLTVAVLNRWLPWAAGK